MRKNKLDQVTDQILTHLSRDFSYTVKVLRTEDNFVAFCNEYDIVTQGYTIAEAVNRMSTSVMLYLAEGPITQRLNFPPPDDVKRSWASRRVISTVVGDADWLFVGTRLFPSKIEVVE